MSWTLKLGLVYHDPMKTFQGYTLFASVRGRQASLIDMDGQIVHQWHDDEGIQHLVLEEDGNILMHTSPPAYLEESERIGGSAISMKQMGRRHALGVPKQTYEPRLRASSQRKLPYASY